MFSSVILSSLNAIVLLYTDPGSGALLLQLIIATLLGGLFYFRRLKDWIFRKLAADTKEISSESKSNNSLKIIGE